MEIPPSPGNIYGIVLQPEIQLQHIGNGLGSLHQLTVPGPGEFSLQKVFQRLPAYQLEYGDFFTAQ